MTPTPRFIGQPHDFDFLVGRWRIHNRRLRQRLVGSDDWIEFEGQSQAWSLMGGLVSIDENDFESQGFSGCSVRTLDLAARRWSIHWVNSRDGKMLPPVHGGFDGEHGEFYGIDEDEGRLVLVRFLWRRGTDRLRWEQAFSLDGQAWETNWTMDSHRLA